MADGTLHFVGPQDIPVPSLSLEDFQRLVEYSIRFTYV